MKSIATIEQEKNFIILPVPDKHQTCLLNFACSETCLHSDPLSEFPLVNKLLV